MDWSAIAGVAFDGFLGAAVGGVAAGLIARWSVLKTIEHERSTQQRSEVRAAVSRLHIAAYRAAMGLPADEDLDGFMDWWKELYWVILETEASVAAADEQLRRDLDELSILMRELLPAAVPGAVGPIIPVHNLATEIALNSYKWLRNPEEFAALPRPLWNKLRARARIAQSEADPE